MRTRAPLVLGCVAIVLAACSIDAVTYTPEPGALAENCAMPGDEDSNGLADCSDPTCAGAPACQAVCGDGVVEQGEQCDDGNLVEGDGCTRNCQVTAIYLKASNTGMGDQFGTVALSADGSTLAVGAASEASGIDGDQVDNSAAGAGAVYVFVRTGSTWIQQAYLKASNAGAGDQFGTRLALSADGSTLAVGAANEASAATGVNGDQTDNSAFRAGAVYVFVRIGSTWAQQAYLKASNAGAGDQFGARLALSGDGSTLAVGAANEASAATGVNRDQADNSASNAGAVYIFARSGATWFQEAYVKASNTEAGDEFGSGVAISGDGTTLAVGAHLEDSATTEIDGNQADNSASNAGAVYVFTRSGTTWLQQAYVKASNAGSNDEFGGSVAVSGNGSILAVGAILEDSAATGINGNQSDNSDPTAGAVYVFTRSGTTWSPQAYIKASNTDSSDALGFEVALSGDGSTLAVGAPLEDSAATGIEGEQADNSVSNAGAVYVFRSSGTTWSQTAYVKASNTGSGDEFGVRLALSGDGSTLAVGAVDEDSAATGIGGDQADNSASTSGAAYVYRGLNQSALVPGSPGL